MFEIWNKRVVLQLGAGLVVVLGCWMEESWNEMGDGGWWQGGLGKDWEGGRVGDEG